MLKKSAKGEILEYLKIVSIFFFNTIEYLTYS